MANLDSEIDELLSALRLVPRKTWNAEATPALAGRCAGSYGCGRIADSITETNTKPKKDFFDDLVHLVSNGVNIEHAVAALARNYESHPSMVQPLRALLSVVRDPDSTKEEFATALANTATAAGTHHAHDDIVNAVLDGLLDTV